MRCPICGANCTPIAEPPEPETDSPAILLSFDGCDCLALLIRGYPVLNEYGDAISEGWTLERFEDEVLAHHEDYPPEPDYYREND